MIKALEFPDIFFKSKDELFFTLKSNEQKLISLKQAHVYKSFEKGQFSYLNYEKDFNSEMKSLINAKDGFIYPIISTTNYMDSHGDVHFNSSMTKTAKEQQGKVVYALDHELKFDSILAWQKNVKMFTKPIEWGLVGKNYTGLTEALIFEIKKDTITRKDVLHSIEEKVSDFQNSIRMMYKKVFLAIDSNEKQYADNKKYFDTKIQSIANKDVALEQGYFWGVEELSIIKEGSLVVAGGSNDATSIYEKEEPSEDTQKDNEPSNDTQKTEVINLFKNFKFIN
jgi:hypothetical protein